KPQPIDLHDFVLRCEDLMGRAVGGKVRLTAEIEPGLPPLMADPTQFELALLNLVFNARDAMPEGGTVLIRGRLASATQASLLLPVSSDPVAAGGAAASAPAEFRPLRVLFVEDDLLVSSVVVPALRAAGHAVRHCHTGDAAARALQDGGLFDVVFSDVVMPGT